jgi:hypothetical protein
MITLHLLSILSVLAFPQGIVDAFVTPRTTPAIVSARRTSSGRAHTSIHALPPISLMVPSILTAEEVSEATAFTDEIDLFGDPTIQKMVGVFTVVVVLMIGFSALMGQMDSSIKNVVVDFERAMKKHYGKRWKKIDAQLKGLDPADRSVKLIKIMEDLQTKEPEFMAKVVQKMAAKVEDVEIVSEKKLPAKKAVSEETVPVEIEVVSEEKVP